MRPKWASLEAPVALGKLDAHLGLFFTVEKPEVPGGTSWCHAALALGRGDWVSETVPFTLQMHFFFFLMSQWGYFSLTPGSGILTIVPYLWIVASWSFSEGTKQEPFFLPSC